MNTEEDTSDVETPDENVQHAELSRHLGQLHEHISQVQRHILGYDESNVLSPSFYLPNSCWTSDEKGRFFHALAIHSRLRPDLIAEHVTTKSLADVCLYLDMLEDTLHSSGSVSSNTGSKFVPMSRRDFPLAHEVTHDWAEYEAQLANSAIAIEPTLLQMQTPRARETEKYNQRIAVRARKGAAHSAGVERDREGEKARNAQFQEWLKSRQSEWDVEDALSELDDVRLRAIDSILREDEDSWSVPRGSTLGSLSTHEEMLLPGAQAGEEKLSEQGDAEIDFAEQDGDAEGSQLTAEAVANLPQGDIPLSPASRKRLRKRLYMRRKRAEKTGQVVDNSMARLKPGRKTKPLKRTAEQDGLEEREEAGGESRRTRHSHPSGKTIPYKIREEFDSLGLDSVRLRQDGLGLFHMTALGQLMRTYNILHDVSEDVCSQISANTIQALEKHVVAFVSQLIRQSIVSRDQEMAAKTQTKVWRLAKSQIITTANVSHALSLLTEKTYDRRQHFANLVKCLNLESDSDSSENAEDTHASTRRSASINNADDYVEPDFDSRYTAPIPLRRTIFPPFVRFSNASPIPSTSHVLHSHPLGTTSLPYDTNGHDEELLPSETDEEGLEAELADEEELDEHDHEQEASYENRLWHIFKPPPEDSELVVSGVKRVHSDGDDDSDSDREKTKKKRLKYKPRVNKKTGQPTGKVKSAPFIEDSDDE
ncbi:hypothetical protein BDY19DRAFT_299970 [Irpex rosettiformis]|uniref:Uncharacterized protein n=1 Tax=Irpex rosettiformis TaxID=378272 RepID=A0ACB8TYL6_9APHY|nr:hypothetical protein BDY19DRAFT_299970 [Irpex rosettiformis]